MTDKDRTFIIRVVTITLACVFVATMTVLLAGLFNPIVSNDEIFKIIGPNLNTIVGAFISIITALIIERRKGNGKDDS